MQQDILPTTKRVLEKAQHVFIHRPNLEKFCAAFSVRNLEGAGLGHYIEQWDAEALVNLTCVFNCANFCFWASEGEQKWAVQINGEFLDGAEALFRSFEEAANNGVPLFDAAFLAEMNREVLGNLLKGNVEIPLLDERLWCLREAGLVLAEKFGGKFMNVVEKSDGDAVKLTNLFIESFASFDDFAVFDGGKVEFHKRAQLNTDMVNHRLVKKGWTKLQNMNKLTVFADYKVPQMLRRLGVLEYDTRLSQKVDSYTEIPTGSREEVEIRALTVWAIEEMKLLLASRYPDIDARQLDDYLWNAGQVKLPDDKPYHRTRTIYY